MSLRRDGPSVGTIELIIAGLMVVGSLIASLVVR
jgi:hypothetical protein